MPDGSDLSQTIQGGQVVQELRTAKPTAYVQNLSDVLHWNPKKPGRTSKPGKTPKKAFDDVVQSIAQPAYLEDSIELLEEKKYDPH